MSLIYYLLGLDEVGRINSASEWVWYAASPASTAMLVVVGVLALVAASLNLLPQTPMPLVNRVSLFFVRIAGFAVLLLMLCQVELRLTYDRLVRPKIAVMTDTSGSMGLKDVDATDEGAEAGSKQSRLAAAQAFAEKNLQSLDVDFDVVNYGFNWRLHNESNSESPDGMTELVKSLSELAQRENDLQAIVLLTDGNDTVGNTGSLVAPIFASRGLPVYPVVFGSAEAAKLPNITVTEGGTYVRLHDELRLSASLSSTGLDEQIVSVHLYEDDDEEPLQTKENVRLGGEPVTVRFVSKPKKAGNRVYRIEMEGVRGAVTERTLVATHHVQVVDSRIQVLYLDSPRDERRFVSHWLGHDPIVDLSTLTLMPKGGWYGTGQLHHKNVGDGLPNNEADMYLYDVIIFGDIPRSYFRQGGDASETKMQRLVDFVRRRGGGLVTLGGRTVYAAGQYQDSKLAEILPFVIEPTTKPQISGTFQLRPTSSGFDHSIFRFDVDPERNRDIIFDLPTLDGCNRVGAVKPGASLLAIRELETEDDDSTAGALDGLLSIGPPEDGAARDDEPERTVDDQETAPLAAIQNVGKGRVLSLTMDTTWRWEMMRPLESESQFRRFWGSTVRALAPDPRVEPRRPQILRYQSHVAVGRRVKMATRLVDTLFKPVRNADIEVEVDSPSKKKTKIYPSDGRQSPGLYEYEFPIDEAGKWTVTTRYNEQEASQDFVAGESPEEFSDPRARPDAMAELAKATGGQLISADEPETLLKNLKLRSKTVTQTASISIWNLPATMVILILLVGIDCLVRKKRGMV